MENTEKSKNMEKKKVVMVKCDSFHYSEIVIYIKII